MVSKTSASPSVNTRRYDSIATLLQGDEVCAASCFDGKNLILANNTGNETEFVQKLLAYLKKVAQKYSEKHEHKALIRLLRALRTEFLEYAKLHVALFSNKTYASRFQQALKKVTRSIKLAYYNPTDPAAFPFKMAEIIRKGENVFLERNPKHQGKLPHAELQIVDYLYKYSQAALSLKVPIYVGVSKKCCGNCECAMRAFNRIKKSNVIAVRGDGHGFNFVAGIPTFLKSNTKMRSVFLAMRKVDALEKAFMNDAGVISGENQLHTPSTSMCESTSLHSSFDSSQSQQELSMDADESSESKIPTNLTSTATIMKDLLPPPPVRAMVPRTPQKPNKPKNKKSHAVNHTQIPKGALSAPALMFPAPSENGQKNPKKNHKNNKQPVPKK